MTIAFDSIETDGEVSEDTSRHEVTTTSFESTTDNTDSTGEAQNPRKLQEMRETVATNRWKRNKLSGLSTFSKVYHQHLRDLLLSLSRNKFNSLLIVKISENRRNTAT